MENQRPLRNSNFSDLIHTHCMCNCIIASKRSKDPVTQVGACIADRTGNVRGSGYNGMPRGCADKEFPWGKHSPDPLENKQLYGVSVCHAEANAILNASGGSLEHCVMYVTLFPCNECAKLIIQSGINEVIYMSDKHAHKASTKAAKRMFDSAKIKYWRWKSNQVVQVELHDNDESHKISELCNAIKTKLL